MHFLVNPRMHEYLNILNTLLNVTAGTNIPGEGKSDSTRSSIQHRRNRRRLSWSFPSHDIRCLRLCFLTDPEEVVHLGVMMPSATTLTYLWNVDVKYHREF